MRIMKTKRKIYPLRISSFSCPKSGKDQKKGFQSEFVHFCAQTFCQSYKRGGGMPKFFILFYANYTILATRASERNFSRGYEGRYRAPKSSWAPQALSGPMSLNHFLSAGCKSSFKSEGDYDIRIQLGPMKTQLDIKLV